VTVDWKVTAGGGSLLARTFPTVTDSEGLALVFWQLGSLGPQSVEATCCGSKETTFTAQAVLSFAQRLTIVSGTWQQDTVGHTLAQPIVVQVLRADGTPDGGAIVGWGTHTPGGRFSPTFARADSAGHASTMWTLGTVAGPETSWVGVRALPPVFVTAGVFPGPPARFTITPNPLPPMGVIGEYLSFISKAWDRYGNLVPAIVSLGAADTNIIGVNSGGDTLRGVQARHHGTTWLTEQIGVVRDSVPVTVLSFSAVSESGDRRCGLSPAGDAYCWGSNYLGAIGDGTQIDRSHPVLVGHGLALGLPSTDYETCALKTSGQAYCWGPDQAGELGDGSPNFASETFQTVPVPVAGGHVFSTIQAGGGFACALATSGDVYCWGGNEIGELGRDTVTATCAWGGIFRCSSWPVPVSGGLKFTLVSAGGDHSCGLTASGAAYCWGRNQQGALGNDSATAPCGLSNPPDPCSYVPRLVEGGLTFTSVKAGYGFTCGVTVGGDAYCWGSNYGGELGDGSTVSSTQPVKVAGGLTFADVHAGFLSACGLTTSGKLYCWGGYNYLASPTPVRPDLQFGALGAGGAASCALTTTNDPYCF